MTETLQPGAMLLIAPESLAKIVEGAVSKAMREQAEAQLMDKFLSVEQVIEQVFGGEVSKSTIYDWAAKGILQRHTIGGRTFFKFGEVMAASKTITKYQRTNS